MNRTTFIKTCGVLCAGGSVLVPVLEGCVPATRYITGVISDETVSIPKSEFTDVIPTDARAHPFILVKIPTISRPVCLYRISDTSYTALSTVCTHRGCEVRPTGEYLECPCHGSEYSISGEVLRGPAESSLKKYRITLDNENITIHL